MAPTDNEIDTAIVLMEAAVKIYKILGFTKEDAKAEVMRTRPSGTPQKIIDQMDFLFDTSWDKING